ncbi:conserved hypothetical protein [delta proteobacterium NaphS2]|nr:conserved hypothetical protein [delta proteobacterium NaphS2]
MDKVDVITKKVDVLPMVKHYMDQLDIYGLFSKYVRKFNTAALRRLELPDFGIRSNQKT